MRTETRNLLLHTVLAFMCALLLLPLTFSESDTAPEQTTVSSEQPAAPAPVAHTPVAGTTTRLTN